MILGLIFGFILALIEAIIIGKFSNEFNGTGVWIIMLTVFIITFALLGGWAKIGFALTVIIMFIAGSKSL